MGQRSRATGRERDFAARSGEQRGGFWPLLLLLVVAAGVLIVLQKRRPEPAGEWVGRALPPLEVGGWLNTDRPLATDDLRGKVVLVEFWATWCPPCVRHMPEVVEFHERFASRGVTVVGLTSESAQAIETVRQFVERMEIEWPIGYDAGVAFNALGIQGIPTYVLYDRTGRSVWGGHSLRGLEDATVAALAKQD